MTGNEIIGTTAYGTLTAQDMWGDEMTWTLVEKSPWEEVSVTTRALRTETLEQVERVINVYYQWEPGAYSHGVAKLMYKQLKITQEGQERVEKIDGVLKTVRYRIGEIEWLTNFAAVHKKIKEGHIGVLPVGNTIAGPVWENMNYFYNTTGIKVVAGRYERIRHMLMGLPGTDISQAQKVISHWQALAQCEGTMREMWLSTEDYWDTAGAAKHISETQDVTKLAIASADAAERYGLEIKRENVQDNPKNRTKFLVIANEEAPVECLKQPNRTIVALHVSEGSGSLDKFLNILSLFRVNSTEIHSSVVTGKNEDLSYNIFLEIEGTQEDEEIQLALLAVSNQKIRSILSNPIVAHITAYLWDGDKCLGLKELWKGSILQALSALSNPNIGIFFTGKSVRYVSENMQQQTQELQERIAAINGHGNELKIGEDISIVWTYFYNELKKEGEEIKS